MNTRKENLKKLRLPSVDVGSSDSRRGRRKATVTATISKFFATEVEVMEGTTKVVTHEYSQPMPSPIAKPEEDETPAVVKRATRTKLSTFLPKDKRLKPAAVEKPISDFLTKRISDDFETPDKNIKKAPKSKAKPRPKKQQKIKTAFLKNEELFTAVTAQHCLVDNIDPDEMQLALALSMSEADDGHPPIAMNDDGKEKKDDIRDKLKQFGFRVAETEDYAVTAFMPTNRKTKWANKFTALTLRNAERQLEKVNRRVEELINTEFLQTDSTHTYEQSAYSVKSELLLPLVARDNIIIRSDPNERLSIEDFYVSSLFEASKTRAGHLLKDVRHIAGRDKSPDRLRSFPKSDFTVDPQLQSPAMKKIRYEETLDHIALSLPCTSANVNGTATLDKRLPATISRFGLNVECLPIDDDQEPVMTFNDSDRVDSTQEAKKTTDKSALSDVDGIKIFDNTETKLELCLNTTTFNNSSSKEISTLAELTPPQISSIEKYSTIRATSPDIFADSDVEMEADNCSEMENLHVSKSSSSGHHLTTYEIFSSDEVKTFSDTKRDSSDMNHNSLAAVIDLTQCESDPSSQHSEKFVSSITLQSYQATQEFSTTSLVLDSPIEATNLKPSKEVDNLCNSADDLPTALESIASTSFRYSNGSCHLQLEAMSPNSFKLNGSYFLEKSTESKRTCFSFGSSASEELYKSTSFNKSSSMHADDSIDLTQNDGDDDIECIDLSDDEINYSIRKADKSLHVNEEEVRKNVTIDYEERNNNSEEKHEFSFVDLVACTQPLDAKTSSNTSLDSLDLDLSKRSDFGILDEQSPFKTPTQTPKKTPRKRTPTSAGSSKCRRALSESFLTSPGENSTHLRHFSSTKKFAVFTKSDDDSLSDLDDIDKLIYGSPSKKAYKKPTGLDQLLKGAISVQPESPKKIESQSPKEFQFNSRTYLVRTTDVEQKPNYEAMDEPALLNNLYKYGIKPLKRKQAVKILEYVYNQTHPYLVDEGDIPSQSPVKTNENCSTALDDNDELEVISAENKSTFNLKDCWGHVIVSNMDIQTEIQDEQYIVQTNTSKKISTALLPFHIAWYNLVKSNKLLHEAILHYEPIDLQEIYLFFKGIGYRYDPKELKYFFDSRSIIFRYDLNKGDPSAGANRHVRKKRLKLTQRSGKNKIS